MASRALYNFNWPLRWWSARDYFTILARCRPAAPRVSILKPPEKLEAVNPSPGCLSQAVKPRVSDNWPLIGQYLPLIGRCPVTSPWPAPCDRDNVSAHRRLSVSQGIRLLSPNKCRHWRSTITRTWNFEGLIFVGPSPFSCSHGLVLTHEPVLFVWNKESIFKYINIKCV